MGHRRAGAPSSRRTNAVPRRGARLRKPGSSSFEGGERTIPFESATLPGSRRSTSLQQSTCKWACGAVRTSTGFGSDPAALLRAIAPMSPARLWSGGALLPFQAARLELSGPPDGPLTIHSPCAGPCGSDQAVWNGRKSIEIPSSDLQRKPSPRRLGFFARRGYGAGRFLLEIDLPEQGRPDVADRCRTIFALWQDYGRPRTRSSPKPWPGASTASQEPE